jgi:hypothetical protein
MTSFQNPFIIFALLLAGSAEASPLADLAACYTRAYTDAHLAGQPKQNVRSLALQVAAQDGVVILSGTNLIGQFGHLLYTCDDDASCGTFEKDSQLWIDLRDDETIVIKTRNAVLSDIGEHYGYVEDNSDNHAFYLEDNDGYHSYTIGSGPFYSFRLTAARSDACPTVP